MYTRQNKSQVKIGYGGYGNFGQVPTNSIRVTHPGTGVSITLTGPVNETGQAVAVVGLLNNAVSGAKSGQIEEANQLLAKARGMLPALGSLSGQVDKMAASAQQAIGMATMSMAAGASAPPATGINPLLIAGGLGVLTLIAVYFLKR